MAIAEQILNSDPNNSAAHRIIVEAADALELPRTAALSYETLSNNSPKDRDLAIAFARALAAAGDVSVGEHSRGEKILMDLLKETPNDGELNQALKDLSARKTLDEGGYAALEGGQGSYRDILKDKKEAVSLEQEKRVQKTEDVTGRLVEEYEARLNRTISSSCARSRNFTRRKNSLSVHWSFTSALEIPKWATIRRWNAPFPTPSCAVSIINWINSIHRRPITQNNPRKFRRRN
jgi:hypothetical protein